jgi:hypothetical protein
MDVWIEEGNGAGRRSAEQLRRIQDGARGRVHPAVAKHCHGGGVWHLVLRLVITMKTILTWGVVVINLISKTQAH